jgi:hypothetical protein
VNTALLVFTTGTNTVRGRLGRFVISCDVVIFAITHGHDRITDQIVHQSGIGLDTDRNSYPVKTNEFDKRITIISPKLEPLVATDVVFIEIDKNKVKTQEKED